MNTKEEMGRKGCWGEGNTKGEEGGEDAKEQESEDDLEGGGHGAIPLAGGERMGLYRGAHDHVCAHATWADFCLVLAGEGVVVKRFSFGVGARMKPCARPRQDGGFGSILRGRRVATALKRMGILWNVVSLVPATA